MSQSVAVIGAGAIGLTSAYFLRKAGLDVTVLDARDPQRNGCSFGNAGMIVPSHFVPLAAPGAVWQGIRWMADPQSPFYVKPRWDGQLLAWAYRFWRAASKEHVLAAGPVLRDLHLRSRQLYEELSKDLEDSFGLTRQGLVMLCKTGQALEEESHVAEKAAALGIPAEVCTPVRLLELDAGMHTSALGGVYFPLDCHIDPAMYMQSMETWLAEQGVTFRWRTSVDAFRTYGRNVLRAVCGEEEIQADHFVLCGGVWSADLAKSLSLNIPMQAGKGYSLTQSGLPLALHMGAILAEARVAVTPVGPSLRFGGAMELSGLSESINRQRVARIAKAATEYFPSLRQEHFAGLEPWVGLRPVSPDGMPYLGRPQRWNNLIVAAGHAMMGVSLAPVSGELVTQCLLRQPHGLDTRLLSPDRYG